MPNNLFQLFFTSAYEPLPPELQSLSLRLKSLYPHHNYILHTLDSARDFLSSTFPPEVQAAFHSLVPLAFKADLVRYCLLYHFGGWYSDITLKHQSGIVLGDGIEFCFFYDFGAGFPSPSRSCHDVMNAFFYSTPSHPILSDVIESILRHCRDYYYGFNSLSVTGPTLLGRSVAQHVPSPSVLTGHFLPLTPSHRNKNRAFVSEDGSIIAWHKSSWHPSQPAPGDISCFNIKTSNNYQHLWDSRQIYHLN